MSQNVSHDASDAVRGRSRDASERPEPETDATADPGAEAEAGAVGPSAARPVIPMWRIAAGVAVGLVVLQMLMLSLFGWPGARSAPRDLPIAVAGPRAAVDALADRLEAQRPGAFTVHAVAAS